MIQVVSYPEFSFAETEEKVNEIINNFDSFITQDGLDRFKASMRSDIIDGLSSVQGKASQLTFLSVDINKTNYILAKKLNVMRQLPLKMLKGFTTNT